jgi:hypothetical protein
LTLLISGSCRQTKSRDTSKHDTKKPETGELIPINFSDTNYIDLGHYAKDTTTADGWFIQYLVKDDSTRYKDLYIVCSKGDIKAIHRGADVLEFRRYFIPKFEAETKKNIYFTHGCATDCSAILVFDKDAAAQFSDYMQVVKYAVLLGQVLYVTDTSYQNEEKIYELALVDIPRHKTHKITFDGICDGTYKPACVDTVIFSKKKVSVTVSLRKTIEDIDQAKQIKTVRL